MSLCPFRVFYYFSTHLRKYFLQHSLLYLSHFSCHQRTLLLIYLHWARAFHNSCHVACRLSKTPCTPCHHPTSWHPRRSWCLCWRYLSILTWFAPSAKLHARTWCHLRTLLPTHPRWSMFLFPSHVFCPFRSCLPRCCHPPKLGSQSRVFCHLNILLGIHCHLYKLIFPYL